METSGAFPLMTWPRQYFSHLENKSGSSNGPMLFPRWAWAGKRAERKADSSVRADLAHLETVLVLPLRSTLTLGAWGVGEGNNSSDLDTKQWNEGQARMIPQCSLQPAEGCYPCSHSDKPPLRLHVNVFWSPQKCNAGKWTDTGLESTGGCFPE